MATKENADLLAKDFVTIKLEDRGIGAQDIRQRFISEDPGLPWFAFLDADGKCLIHSSGSDGRNIGHPVRDNEIAYFRIMLETVKEKFTDHDIEVLIQSLEDFNKAAGLQSSNRQ